MQSLSKEAGRTFKESAGQPAAKAEARKAQPAKPAGKAQVRKARGGARKQSLRNRAPRPSFGQFFDQRLATVRLGAAKKQAFVNKRSSAVKSASAANITAGIVRMPVWREHDR